MDSDLTPGLVFALGWLVLAQLPVWYLIWRIAHKALGMAAQSQKAALYMSKREGSSVAAHSIDTGAAQDRPRPVQVPKQFAAQ
jgi:hypothetical protein